jgi:aspartate/methionine/tyrosine aminotransferase
MAASEAISRVSISNVVCPVGIAQQAAAAAIETGEDSIRACTSIWKDRHDQLLHALRPRFDVIAAHGGWSMLIDFSRFGLTGAQASQRLLPQGVAATSMENWGRSDTAKYLRLVFANEPAQRLASIAARFDAAFPR